MIPRRLKTIIKQNNLVFHGERRKDYVTPKFNPLKYYRSISSDKYYKALAVLRHNIERISDYYFTEKINAINVDLFMLTNSISSPMGPGSDSEPINIKFGKYKTSLVDSSQFGFEPFLINHIDSAYCYLPSMRGENPDKRHLNQFYHCEMETTKSLDMLIPIIEGYIKILSENFLALSEIISLVSNNPKRTSSCLNKIISTKSFPQIEYEEAVKLLLEKCRYDCIKRTKHGTIITSKGEIELFNILKTDLPVWLCNFPRDLVPFYQKPNPKNKELTINADLIFKPIIKNSFGGEIAGSGQRQDNIKEIYESFARQNIKPANYEWYIDLRRMKNYKTTSGFGLGIERFISWALAKDNIRDASLYPRLKNVKMFP